jgi:hypothetical protein
MRFPSEPLPIKSLKSKCRFFSDINKSKIGR